jgi:hypothetical protein
MLYTKIKKGKGESLLLTIFYLILFENSREKTQNEQKWSKQNRALFIKFSLLKLT